MTKRKIAVVLVDRANYGRMKPVLGALAAQPDIEMQVVCSGTMVLERFGQAMKIVEKDGFEIASETYIELEGSTPATMVKSVGFAVIEFSSEFQRLKPDMVLIIGDRYEALAAGIAAGYMNICVAHIQGGEVSGSIDETTRHCLTKIAHYHFPSTARAADYIIRMGERPDTVFHVGCPSGDIALKLDKTLRPELFTKGVGATLDPAKPYMLVVFHPVTTEFGEESEETQNLLEAMAETGHQVVWMWPNIDAGADHVSKTLRRYREAHNPQWLRLVKNYTPDDYLRVMANATCLVGNSSSFVRDSTFFGTPVVLVGDRQHGRETGANLLPAQDDKASILAGIKQQLAHGRYPISDLYGRGDASQRIAETLVEVPLYVQKTLAYERR